MGDKCKMRAGLGAGPNGKPVVELVGPLSQSVAARRTCFAVEKVCPKRDKKNPLGGVSSLNPGW